MLTHYTTQIRDAHSKLDCTLGWEFLYTPASTLSCPNGFMLLGINPGGDTFGITESVEEGNAYLVEQWSPDGTPLQEQVKAFFEVLANKFVGRPGQGEILLNETLTTNFCPFRSPVWRELPKQKEAIAFSKSLWTQLLSQVSPHVILCMGSKPYPHLKQILRQQFTVSREEKLLPTGWGNYQFAIQVFKGSNHPIVLARLLHFSQYKLMSREACIPHVQAFVRYLPP